MRQVVIATVVLGFASVFAQQPLPEGPRITAKRPTQSAIQREGPNNDSGTAAYATLPQGQTNIVTVNQQTYAAQHETEAADDTNKEIAKFTGKVATYTRW